MDERSFSEMTIVCEHCTAMEHVLTDLLGNKVSRVIMSRVVDQLHGEPRTSTATAFPSEAPVEVVAISHAPKRYLIEG
jgi:hypothetical protein